MAFVNTISEKEATGLIKELYTADQEKLGYIPNYTQALSLRPEVLVAWQNLLKSFRTNMRLRRYELVTIAAATALKCTYCSFVHGTILSSSVFSPEEVTAIVRDYRNAGLKPDEVSMMSYAQKIVIDANQITQKDIDELRSHDLTDEEILDITFTATGRSFFSKTLDALGAVPDMKYMEIDEDLRNLLTVGREFPPK